MEKITDENQRERAAFFAHEIKNPLAVLKANVQLIEPDYNGENKKSFMTIYECIDNINKLISENMDYIKSETVRGGSDAVKIMKMVLRKYSVTGKRNFGFKTDRETVPVRCEEKLLESLFENLIKNAVEATEEGDEINAEIRVRRGKAVIKISDAGCGISDTELARVSDLFYTTKKGGSGVGLFMCRRIAEQNGGRLKIEKNRPKGTKVTVELGLKSGV